LIPALAYPSRAAGEPVTRAENREYGQIDASGLNDRAGIGYPRRRTLGMDWKSMSVTYGIDRNFYPEGVTQQSPGSPQAHPGYRMRHANGTLEGFHMRSRAGADIAIRCGRIVEPHWGSKETNGT